MGEENSPQSHPFSSSFPCSSASWFLPLTPLLFCKNVEHPSRPVFLWGLFPGWCYFSSSNKALGVGTGWGGDAERAPAIRYPRKKHSLRQDGGPKSGLGATEGQARALRGWKSLALIYTPLHYLPWGVKFTDREGCW